MTDHLDSLRRATACREAIDFASDFPSLQAAWDACERGDWMLWWAGRCSGSSESASRKKLVLAACKCARLSLKYLPKGESRPLKAIRTTEDWAKGTPGVTLGVVRAAANAAANAAYAAAYAADAAAYAANAANAAYAAAKAADAAGAGTIKTKIIKYGIKLIKGNKKVI